MDHSESSSVSKVGFWGVLGILDLLLKIWASSLARESREIFAEVFVAGVPCITVMTGVSEQGSVFDRELDNDLPRSEARVLGGRSFTPSRQVEVKSELRKLSLV